MNEEMKEIGMKEIEMKEMEMKEIRIKEVVVKEIGIKEIETKEMSIWKKIPHPGFRNIKTAIAVVFCIALYELIDRSGAVMAAIAAIICMQDSVEKSIQLGKIRVIGTALGGLFGIALTSLGLFQAGQAIRFLSLFVGVVLFIYICNCIKKNESIVIGLVVFIVLAMDAEMDAPLLYSVNRVLDTIVGIIVAISVNRILFKPDGPPDPLEDF